jgi:glycerol-3-phosphate acyltransferase PlsY
LAIVLAYLIGGTPIGVLIGRAKGVDIRRVGSGNIGASNVMRVLGMKLGLLAFAGDVLKGALPVLVARSLFHLTHEPSGWALPACGAAAVIGHCYSPYLRFAGGKAVATGLGIILAIQWPVGVVCFSTWIIVVALTRYISVASMVAYGVSPLVAWAFGGAGSTIAMAGFLALLSAYRHRENIRRLLAGTESKIGQRVKGEAPTDRGEQCHG